MLRPYKEYLEQDVEFDYSSTRTLLERQGLRAPVIDYEQINRLIELAGSRPTPTCRLGDPPKSSRELKSADQAHG